jgi:folate-dependent tRNA-U54 methylase TrmFO/GidA
MCITNAIPYQSHEERNWVKSRYNDSTCNGNSYLTDDFKQCPFNKSVYSAYNKALVKSHT